MSDLVIEDLVVEFSSGGLMIRPLNGVSFEAPSGSLVVLLGPSGCGKTTLLSCLGGILTPTSGTIRFGDTQISGSTGAQLDEHRRHGVGIVFQAFNLIPSLTATENVMAPLLAAGWRRNQAAVRAADLLEQVDLTDRRHHRPSQLSGGQMQRVAVARAIANDPPLVIADEPTANLDHLQVDGVIRLLRNLAQPGRVVVVATHDDRLLPLADVLVDLVPKPPVQEREPTVVHFDDGQIVFDQGSHGSLIYVVDEGEVEILREHDDGRLELLVVRRPGEHFGEMAPLFRIPRSATARARGTTRLTGYTTEQFREHLGVSTLTELIPTMGSPDLG